MAYATKYFIYIFDLPTIVLSPTMVFLFYQTRDNLDSAQTGIENIFLGIFSLLSSTLFSTASSAAP